MTTGKTIALTRWVFVGKVMSLLFNMLSRLVTFKAYEPYKWHRKKTKRELKSLNDFMKTEVGCRCLLWWLKVLYLQRSQVGYKEKSIRVMTESVWKMSEIEYKSWGQKADCSRFKIGRVVRKTVSFVKRTRLYTVLTLGLLEPLLNGSIVAEENVCIIKNAFNQR